MKAKDDVKGMYTRKRKVSAHNKELWNETTLIGKSI